MQKPPSCKEVQPSQVESYIKDECMVWLTTRVISECGQGLSTDSQCIDQELNNLWHAKTA